MSKLSTNPDFLSALMLVVLVFAVSGLVMLYQLWRKGKQAEEGAVTKSDWRPTGKIDFYCAEMPKDDHSPATFILRVEEYCAIQSISGVEHTEIRWRKAMLSEAKSVLVGHQNSSNALKAGHNAPRLVGT